MLWIDAGQAKALLRRRMGSHRDVDARDALSERRAKRYEKRLSTRVFVDWVA